jgi:hypothetical protein
LSFSFSISQWSSIAIVQKNSTPSFRLLPSGLKQQEIRFFEVIHGNIAQTPHEGAQSPVEKTYAIFFPHGMQSFMFVGQAKPTFPRLRQ